MAISRIRGEQIRQNVLVNAHIADEAAIHESKLDVNWSSHYAEALETKKVVDFVQVGNQSVGDASELNLSSAGVLMGTAPITTSLDSSEGVITDAPYNKVIIRDSNSGDSFLTETEAEVYGRLVHDGVDFKVLFFSVEAEVETAFTMPTGAEIDFQYMERFNLRTVSELFAANEKFVAGAADITAFQNIQQLAKDIYGSGYTLDRDGEGNLTVSLKEQIANESLDRTQEMAEHKANLLTSGEAGKGANLIGIEDLANVFTAVTVEGALQELEGRMQAVEQSGGVEVTDARDSSLTGAHATLDERIEADVAEIIEQLTSENQRAAAAESANADAIAAEVTRASDEEARIEGKINAAQLEIDEAKDSAVKIKEFASIDERLEEAEQDHKNLSEQVATKDLEQDGRLDSVEAEIEAARGSEESVDVRLDRALNENGTLKEGAKIHEHFRARFQAVGGEAEVLLSEFNKPGLPSFQIGDDSLEVFINGQLQEPGLNYQEGLLGDKIIFDLGDGTVLVPTDIVQIKYYINNAE
jgi:hypothetical protein